MKKYKTEEERQEAKRKSRKKWRDAHQEYQPSYYEKNKDSILEYNKAYSKTQMGRALSQRGQYRRMDRRNGFGDVIDFDAKWIVENIYTQPCVHCGETDWHKLGCNRLDNLKPHIKENVEPCCFDCNIKLAAEYMSKKNVKSPVAQIDTKTGEIIKIYRCAYDAIKEGFTHADAVARGERKQNKGYIFKYINTIEDNEQFIEQTLYKNS